MISAVGFPPFSLLSASVVRLCNLPALAVCLHSCDRETEGEERRGKTRGVRQLVLRDLPFFSSFPSSFPLLRLLRFDCLSLRSERLFPLLSLSLSPGDPSSQLQSTAAAAAAAPVVVVPEMKLR